MFSTVCFENQSGLSVCRGVARYKDWAAIMYPLKQSERSERSVSRRGVKGPA